MESLLYGRALLESEMKEIPNRALSRPAMLEEGGKWICQRCGNQDPDKFYKLPCSCGDSCFYCSSCLNMGQVKSCSNLYYLEEKNDFPSPKEPILTWEGSLSAQQAQASKEIIESINQKEERLIWAVAGAGKTEMLFEGIAHALRLKQRVCIASPRVDVCLELAPRLQSAFAQVDIITLYGGMEEDYRYTPLLVATTHQLLRFKEAFDLLVVDEVDAFPYYNNRSLYYASAQARKKESTLIYLSATPDQYLQARVKQKSIQASILPARYHGHILPVPKFVWAGDWSKNLLDQPTKSVIIKNMEAKLKAGRCFLVFCPQINWMQKFEKLCRKIFPKAAFASVYSQDPDRKKKVLAMRQEAYDFLLTSTILERGVTFKNIDVLVIGAEERIFTESALVQIAGRVGRSPAFPTGEVIFFHYGKSRGMKGAKNQIKKMNRLAKERGLIK